ncbi:MAG TPA: hypothetical protein VFV94_09410 [Polyangiaceae bacterium]|nr:hypothetical protein [Polyangiaceae bacterium]
MEAADKRALSSGVRSVTIRIARYVNDLLSRRGPLWADRWHGRALRTPREVRHGLVYVLANFRKHTVRGLPAPRGLDPYSSAHWFDGFREWQPFSGRAPPLAFARAWPEDDEPLVTTPRTWLARIGWRRRGLLSIDDQPAPAR